SVTVEDKVLSPSNSDAEATKQDLVNRLISEAKRRNGLVGSDNSGKGKAVELDGDPKPSLAGGRKLKVQNGLRFTPRMPAGEVPCNWNFHENIWKKRELSKARNQWEYNE
ncbi:12894_t:CDS:2, partial [Gigaspora rosea]